jgi:hypothetical protein
MTIPSCILFTSTSGLRPTGEHGYQPVPYDTPVIREPYWPAFGEGRDRIPRPKPKEELHGSCGCVVNDERIGGRSGNGYALLELGDNVVVVGGEMSPYQFRVDVRPA